MSKKVVTWDAPKLHKAEGTGKKARTFKEMWERGQQVEKEQQEAQAYLQKAMPGMQAIFDLKAQRGEPFVVMRPLNYMTSGLNVEEDDGFYAVKKSEQPKFVDQQKTIMPGTSLILKAVDSVLNEYIFVDGRGKEHAISMDQKNAILTQTDVFETVKQYLDLKGE